MNNNESIKVKLFGEEVGIIAYNADKAKTYFQFHPQFLESGLNAFPFVLKKTPVTQVFSIYNTPTFKGLPPMFADSLPDAFGNLILNKWLDSREGGQARLSPIEQLAYLSNRAMGALEYEPHKVIPEYGEIGLTNIQNILTKVLQSKENTAQTSLDEAGLFGILKIGTSAGGARPKIIVAEDKQTGVLLPGDTLTSEKYNHLIVKMYLPDIDKDFNPSKLEYAYYLMAIDSGLDMMPSKLIENQHFATLRYDRVNGEKIHTLTATGLTGWDFKSSDNSSYENLFQLALALKVPHQSIEQIFTRMVFNVVNANIDDHLKNHSFQFNPKSNSWKTTPSYDLVYPINPFAKYTRLERAMSINGKRNNITFDDIMAIAKKQGVRKPLKIISTINKVSQNWTTYAEKAQIDEPTLLAIAKDLKPLLKLD